MELKKDFFLVKITKKSSFVFAIILSNSPFYLIWLSLYVVYQ